MARRGRPPMGPDLVGNMEGSPEAKERLRVILETIAQKKSVVEACRDLGISEGMFYRIRDRTMADALESLEPRPLGRPRREDAPGGETGELERLKEENDRLKMELQASRIREELAIVMPHVLKKKRKS
jgi:transposase-like protein